MFTLFATEVEPHLAQAHNVSVRPVSCDVYGMIIASASDRTSNARAMRHVEAARVGEKTAARDGGAAQERDAVEASTPDLNAIHKPLQPSCTIKLTRPLASTLIWSVAWR